MKFIGELNPDKSDTGLLRYMVDSLAQIPRKDVASCNKSRVVARKHRTWNFLMGLPVIRSLREWGRGELKHLSTRRKRKQCDSLSTGDRRGNRTNRIRVSNYMEMWGLDLGFCLTNQFKVCWKTALETVIAR